MALPKEPYDEWKKVLQQVLLPSGLDAKWRADSMECFSYLRNIQDLVADGKTPDAWRFGEPFKGPTIPFGAMVHSTSLEDQARIHEFDMKVLAGIFLGCELILGWNMEKDIFWLQT